MDKEIWKDIKGFEGIYQISNFGNIKSLSRKTKNGKCKSDKILKKTLDNKGYQNITIHKNFKKSIFKVHRLVAEAFIPNPYNKPQVNHIDGNKTNNLVTNLEWCTNSENQIHSYKNGLKQTKKVYQYDLNNNLIKEWENATQASKYYDVHISRIIRCCENAYGCKTCKNFIWKYEKNMI
jgi:hypothetical protein